MRNGTESLIEGINRSWMHFKSPKMVYPMQIYEHFVRRNFSAGASHFIRSIIFIFRNDTTFEFYSARIYQFCATPFKDFIIQFRLMVDYFHYFRNLEFFIQEIFSSRLCYLVLSSSLLVKTVKHGVGKSIS